MTPEEIRKKVFMSDEYDFLKNSERLGDRVILLGVCGSHSCGLATETSDIDLRGVTLDTREELLLGRRY